MKKYENLFIDNSQTLLLSMAIFHQSCRTLLQDLPDKQIRDLLDLRSGWDKLELEEKLEPRLGEDFMIYKASVRQLNKKVEKLRTKLKLGEDLTVRVLQRWSLSMA